MKYLCLFIVYFTVIYIIYLITVVCRKSKMKKFSESRQVQFFVTNYGLDLKKIKLSKFVNLIAIVNSLIMSIALIIAEFIDGWILKVLVLFVVLIPLILIAYSILGKYIQKEGVKKHV